jgi:hypothetical protein
VRPRAELRYRRIGLIAAVAIVLWILVGLAAWVIFK